MSSVKSEDSSTATDYDIRRNDALWTAAVMIGVAVLLSPLARWQFGWKGVGAVAVFAVAMLGSLWISAASADALERTGRPTAALLVGSAVRLVVPLILALAVALQRDLLISLTCVIYMVPMYLAMLAVETVLQWRRLSGGSGPFSHKWGRS